MSDSFVHLHNHTEFSMLDGAARIEDMVLTAQADGQSAIAITDHGNLYGILDFYKTCRKHGMKPIIGLEAYMAAESRFERPALRGRVSDDMGGDAENGEKQYYHLSVYAENNVGYHNLIQLSSLAFLEGYYRKPRIDWDLLSRYHEGLIATTGCLGGVVLQALMRDDYERAVTLAARLQDIFGKDSLFVEVQDHGMPEQRRTNPELVRLAKQIGAPLLATNDIHYVRREDATMHDALLCVGTNSLISDEKRFRFASMDHYLRSAQEMRHLFAELPEACDNTLWIAERANVDISFDNEALPQFPIPDEFAGETHGERANAYLRHLTFEGARERYGQDLPAHVVERLEYELGVIIDMGFPDYFLVVWDLIRYARDAKIRVGPGRGSAAGCCVAYCLRIVDVDPIHYGLIFERFLNPGRKSMPDIDMDFDDRYRGQMIKYAAEKYGSDHVAQIVTFSTIKARAAVRDAARVLGLPPMLGDQVAKAMPPLLMGKDVPLAACLTPTSGYENRYAEAQGLRDMYESDPQVRQVVDVAKGLEGKRRQDGIHAAAVVITREPVTEYVPIQRKPGVGEDPTDAPIVTQFEMHGVEELGLLKMDFLGLRNLSIMERCLDLIERRTGERIDIDNVPIDDQDVLAMLRRGESIGLFQLESPNMRALMRRLAPTSFDDVAALVALYRPGPMGENVHNDYADRKNGRQQVSYEHPDLEAVLGTTYGLMIYQEDIMRVAQKIAGYSMTEADNLRKACGKKIREMIAAERENFVAGAARTGYGEELGTLLFNKIEPFADYAFNKSHAFGYALIAYQNAWLKAHYPVEFMSALLTSFRDDKDKTAQYLSECRAMGITVTVPNVNDSFADFAPSRVLENTISFGMAAVRNVGESLVDKIVAEREENGLFESIYDFVRRVDPIVLNKRSMESLIKSGAFDVFGLSRQGLLLIHEELVSSTLDRRRDIQQGISSLFSMLDDSAGDWTGTEIPVPAAEFDRTARMGFEREMLGLFISDHPLAGHEATLASMIDCSIADLRAEFDENTNNGGIVREIGGLVVDLSVKTAQSGKQFAKVVLEDLSGVIEFMVFGKTFTEYGHLLGKDATVIVKVRCDERNDEMRVTALDVKPANLSGAPASTLRLKMVGRLAQPSGISELKALLGQYPGETPVTLIVETTRKSFQLGPEFAVDLPKVVGPLRSAFGSHCIA